MVLGTRAPGQLALLRFPNTNLEVGKLRPVLLLAKTPGRYNAWLLAMISTKLEQAVEGFDETITPEAPDFESSGLKAASVIRISRLAVVDESILKGKLGDIAPERLERIRRRLADWLTS